MKQLQWNPMNLTNNKVLIDSFTKRLDDFVIIKVLSDSLTESSEDFVH